MTKERVVSRMEELKAFAKDRLAEEAGRAEELLHREERRLDELEAEYRRTVCELTAMQASGPVAASELSLFSSYLLECAKRIERQKEVVKKRRLELKAKRHAVYAAYKEQRVFELFHDRLVVEKTRDATTREQKESDERFLLRRRGR